MSERKYKAGDVVEMTAVQEDENGEVISEVTARRFGNPNAEANVMSMDLLGSTFKTVDGWRTAKAQGKKPGQA